MSDQFNELTPAEAERLAMLAEEAGEIVQAVGKILRHGYGSYNPTLPTNEQVSNRLYLGREIGNLNAIVKLMVGSRDGRGDLIYSTILDGEKAKFENMRKWTHHQSDALNKASP